MKDLKEKQTKIFNEYLEVYDLVTSNPAAFPSGKYPESLLKNSKKEIEESFIIHEFGKDYKDKKDDMKEAFKVAKMVLDRFVSDEEAITSNNHAIITALKNSK